MANSRYYSATDEDVRPWVATEVPRTSTADEASQAVADALQTATRDANPITAISIQSTMNLDLSDVETEQIVITTTPASQNGLYTYASSDPTKATVSSTGLVTPIATGTTTITVTAVHDGAVSDTCAVTVVA